MNDSDYVSSGRFKLDLETLFGPLVAKEPEEDDEDGEDFIGRLPGPLAKEVRALHALTEAFEVPELCGLEVGSFVTIPSQYDLDADGVREEEWFYDDHDIAVVMQSVEIFRESGSPSFLVGPFGIVQFDEDPHGYTVIGEALEPFLRTLLALEAASTGKGPLAAAEALVREHVRSSPKSKSRRRSSRPMPDSTEVTLPGFVRNALEEAQAR